MRRHIKHSLRILCYRFVVFCGDFAESQPSDFKDPIDEEEFADDYGYFSDSDLEDDEDEKPLVKQGSKPEVHSFDPFVTTGEEKVVYENYEEHVEKGKVVKISDVAFVT